MSRDNAHPALHTPPLEPHLKHYVPEGWEFLNRGLCPCGEVVIWDNESDESRWVPDRTMRVLVLTGAEAHAMAGRIGADQGVTQFEQQLDLQDEILSYEQPEHEFEGAFCVNCGVDEASSFANEPCGGLDG